MTTITHVPLTPLYFIPVPFLYLRLHMHISNPFLILQTLFQFPLQFQTISKPPKHSLSQFFCTKPISSFWYGSLHQPTDPKPPNPPNPHSVLHTPSPNHYSLRSYFLSYWSWYCHSHYHWPLLVVSSSNGEVVVLSTTTLNISFSVMTPCCFHVYSIFPYCQFFP